MTFAKLDFNERQYNMGGVHAKHFFENGYGVSVVCGPGTYGYNSGLYEVAVIEGKEEDWDIVYDTGITSDVVGHLTPNEVTEIMSDVESLEPRAVKLLKAGEEVKLLKEKN